MTAPDHIIVTADPANEPAPETAVDHPEFPAVDPGRVTSILRRLVANALRRKEIDEQDGVEMMRFLDAA